MKMNTDKPDNLRAAYTPIIVEFMQDLRRRVAEVYGDPKHVEVVEHYKDLRVLIQEEAQDLLGDRITDLESHLDCANRERDAVKSWIASKNGRLALEGKMTSSEAMEKDLAIDERDARIAELEAENEELQSKVSDLGDTLTEVQEELDERLDDLKGGI